MDSNPQVMTGVDQISRTSALCCNRESLLPQCCLPSDPGDEGGEISCLLRPFCSEARINALSIPGGQENMANDKKLFAHHLLPIQGGKGITLGETSLGIPRLHPKLDSVSAPIIGSTSLMATPPYHWQEPIDCHSGTQTVPGRRFLIKQGCTKMPEQPDASARNPGISTQRTSNARGGGRSHSIVSRDG